jgi:hypothetical protein
MPGLVASGTPCSSDCEHKAKAHEWCWFSVTGSWPPQQTTAVNCISRPLELPVRYTGRGEGPCGPSRHWERRDKDIYHLILLDLWQRFLVRPVRNIATKSTIRFVGPSVRIKQLGFHRTDFHEIRFSYSFRKSVKKSQVSLKSEKRAALHEDQYNTILLNSSQNSKYSTQKL